MSCDIHQALQDPLLLGAALGRDLTPWAPWVAVLKAAFGLGLDDDRERILFRKIANRRPPKQRVSELWAIVGRRGGKSRVAALIAVYLAAIVDHRAVLAAGETGMVLVVASSRAQAGVILAYCRAFLRSSPIMATAIIGEKDDEVRLVDNVVIRVVANSPKSIRGPTLLACIFDEVGHWKDTGEWSDREVLRAAQPALSTTHGMLIGISSPHRASGLLHDKAQLFGRSDPEVLVIRATSSQMNPTLDRKIVARAKRTDAVSARTEYDAEFRSAERSALLDEDVLESATDQGVTVRAAQPNISYAAFVDSASGVKGGDSFAAAIAHRDGVLLLLDAVLEIRPPFRPQDAIAEVAKLMRSYRCRVCSSDRFATVFVRAGFAAHAIEVIDPSGSASQLYLEFSVLLSTGNVRLLDVPLLHTQLGELTRRTLVGGRDKVSHLRGRHDDIAISVAGALTLAAAKQARHEAQAPRVDLAVMSPPRLQPGAIGWGASGGGPPPGGWPRDRKVPFSF